MISLHSRRLASSWGMSSLWERVRGGFSRTDAAVEKLKAQQKVKAPGATNNSEIKSASPWDAIQKAQLGVKEPAPTQLWMHSPFIRGSTLKMTGLARQIIGLPLDAAILQMHFSKKKMSKTVTDLLSSMKGTLKQKGANTAYYYIKSATVGRGVYLKRLEIRARGKRGIQWRGHTFIRVCCHRPDPASMVRKMLKIRKIFREDKPIMKKLDYY
jgi:ribosomal protein L22